MGLRGVSLLGFNRIRWLAWWGIPLSFHHNNQVGGTKVWQWAYSQILGHTQKHAEHVKTAS